MTSKILLCLLVSSSLVRANVIRSTSNSRGNIAPQTCGTDNTNYYCPVDRLCKPRSQRCTHANVCNNPTTNTEDGCYETSISGLYNVRLGHAILFGSSGSKQYDLEHQFIVYRGFAYELGKSYQVQILDTADPQYKYRNGMDLNSKGIEVVGSGYCTWEDATMFVNGWKSYNFAINNCQHFAIALQEFLTTGVCSVPISNRVKREDHTADLNQQINDILQNCSIVCCDSEGNSVVSMSPIMMFIIFNIILVIVIM